MDDMTDSERSLARPEIAVAIITSDLGVLIGRRREENPPWTFPGGKIEPGEPPEDAAVRETLEEAGLRVRATGVIGIRVRPVTGVRMVYVAAESIGTPEIRSRGADFGSRELMEVRWFSKAEADELMGELFDDVQQFLRQKLAPF